MGPVKGTPEWKNQVDTIWTQFTAAALTKEDLSQFIFMFLLDRSYSRSAIAEADHKILNQKVKLKKPTITKLKKKADKLWAEYIKSRQNFTCEKCDRSDRQIQYHHFYGRRIMATRYDPDNGFCLCASCHKLDIHSAHEDPQTFWEWAVVYRGSVWYHEIMKRSKQIVHYKIFDYLEIIKDLQNKIIGLETWK